jgi:hypothetical protein
MVSFLKGRRMYLNIQNREERKMKQSTVPPTSAAPQAAAAVVALEAMP